MFKMNKIDTARQAFDSLKSQGYSISKASVAKLANISRTLLTPRPDGSYKSNHWKTLANDIAAYQSSHKPLKTIDRFRSKMQELRKARDESERKYHSQVKQTVDLHTEIVIIRNESADYKAAYDNLIVENEKLQKQLRSVSVLYDKPAEAKIGHVISISSVTISPDEELIRLKGGKYEWDKLAARQAHTSARQNLAKVLGRAIKKRLFILIGRPGSGKTTWCNSFKPPHDGRLSIYYDATNPTIADRWEIQHIAKNANDTTICYVYFDIDINKCINNSNKRKDRSIPEHVVSNMSVEPPELSEGFDELIIIR